MDNPAEDIQQPYDTLIKAFFRSEMGTLVSYFLKGRIDGEIKGKIELILEMLHPHFSEATAELVELALRKVDIRAAEVIEPLKEATVKLDEQGVNRWLRQHLSTE